MVSEEDERDLIVCKIHRYGRDRSSSRSPHVAAKGSEASHLPGLLVSNTSNFVQEGGLGRSKIDEDVVCKELDILFVHALWELNEGE